jgi:thioredoxin-related protein
MIHFMRKILLFILLFFISGNLVLKAQVVKLNNVKWYTIQQALELQKKEPRKILIDVYTDWCGWCKKMDNETFSHPVVAEYLNKHYYPVKFNAESYDSIVFQGHTFINENKGARSTHQFAIALLRGQLSYPSVAYLTENLQLIAAVPGFFTADNLEPLLNFIVEDKFKSISLDDYKKTFTSQIKK